MKRLLSFILLVQTIWASPFELTEKYIEEFQHGIDNLIKEAHETQYVEGSLEGVELNEEEALKHAETYDFIVVGGGSSGAVVASRLSEVPEWNVLLLEAGAPESAYSLIPAMTDVVRATSYNWGYKAEPQKTACLGMIDNKCTWESGKALGGRSAINHMLYTRGNEKDYDLWADNGNDEWCYRDVLPYFKKQEDAQLKNFDRKFHSQGGPVMVEDPQHLSNLAHAFIEAGKELGLEEVDYNGKHQNGVSIPQVNTKHGKRESTAQSYLIPNKQRKNLIVRPLSQAIQVLISPHTKEATGVKYLHGGKLFVAKAEKEVILSAGALNSPQLLMLSGVGPKEDLEHLGIEVLHDLPVGHNLKDHVTFPGVNFYFNHSIEHLEPHESLVQLLKERRGPLTTTGIEGIGYIKTEVSEDKTHYPDVELLMNLNKFNEGYEQMKHHNYKKEIYDSIWHPLEGKQMLTIQVALQHPKSTGVVKLKSKDPLHWPVLHANLLSDPDDHDLLTMLHGVKKAVEFGKTETFHKIGAQLNEHPVLGCEAHEFGSDPYWKCAIRHLSTNSKDHMGTCRMGPNTDKEAVVDNRLRVHGIHKLRVADTSVIPVTITGHLNAPAMMVGEKAADLIKEDWHHGHKA